MLRLAWNILYGKRKKYRALFWCVAIGLFSIMTIDTMYRGYCDAQIENAYDYGGHWDIYIRTTGDYYDQYENLSENLVQYVGMNTATYSLQLDEVADEKKYGFDYITHYYLSLLGIRSESENVLPYHLKEGRWPSKSTEIVLPYTMEFAGRTAKNGSLKIGDVLRLNFGRRLNSTGEYTQEQVNGIEQFISEGEKEYTICGFIDYVEYTTDKFVLYGFSGIDGSTNLEKEEIVLYYYLLEKNTAAMEKAYRYLSEQEGILEVSTNSYVESAFMVLENSNYLHTVRNGLLIVEGMLLFVGICIAAANQYQNIREDRKQIMLFYSLGAEKGQLYALFEMVNLGVLTLGALFSMVLYYAFIKIIQISIFTNIRNMFFKAGNFSPDVAFCIMAFCLFVGCIFSVTVVILYNQISVQDKQECRRIKVYRRELTNLMDLSKQNLQQMRFRRVIQELIILILLIFAPICSMLTMHTYEIAAGITRDRAADFYMVKKGYSDELDKKLMALPHVKQITKKIGGNRKLNIPLEYLGEDVAEELKKVYNVEFIMSDPIFSENDEFISSVSVIFIDKAHYEKLEAMNPGELGDYEDFINGENNCIIFARMCIEDTGEQIDVGKRISEKTDEIELYSFVDEEIHYSLKIVDSVFEADADYGEGSLMVLIYLPLQLYETYKMDMSITTSYFVDGYNGTMDLLGETLKELAYQNGYHLQDNVSESSAQKDAMVIQTLSTFSIFVVGLIMSVAALRIMGKIDYLSRKETYEIYKALGLEHKGAFFIFLLEQMIPLTDAVMLGAGIHCILFYTILRDLYTHYNIGLSEITVAFLLCIIGVLLLFLINTTVITNARYSKQRE